MGDFDGVRQAAAPSWSSARRMFHSAGVTEESSPESATVLAGARTARFAEVERAGPENPGPAASRDDDRLVVVTQGELTAEIAERAAPVPAQAVIVIPAGVPHQIWNPSSAPVRYLDADVPAPRAYTELVPAR
jgi:mannose-6-phosphate isomerase-like protein (cupin superfamily)